MKYQIRRVPIQFKVGELIHFDAQPLCKVLEVDVFSGGAYVIILERFGQEKSKEKSHRIIILEEGRETELTFPYEPTLSRRSKFIFKGSTYYTFSL